MQRVYADGSEPPSSERLTWLLLRRVYQREASGCAFSAVSSAVLAAVVWAYAPGSWIPLLWWLALAALLGLRLRLAHRFHRHAGTDSLATWSRRHALTTTATGLGWGLGGAAMLLWAVTPQSQTAILVVVAAMATAALAYQGAMTRSYLGYLLGAVLPLAVAMFIKGDLANGTLGFFALLFCAAMWVIARHYQADLRATLQLGEEKHGLSEKLAAANRQLQSDVDARLRAENLLGIEKTVLENVANQIALPAVLDELNLDIEALFPGSLCSVLLLDEDGVHARHGSAPSLDPAFNASINGQPIGPGAGSCGTAMYRGEPVITEDIARDPLWHDYRELALRHELRACWSMPILSRPGTVLGSFAVYRREPGAPDHQELDTITRLSRLIALVVQSIRNSETIQNNEQRFRDFAAAAGDWFWEVDRNLEYTYVSKQSLKDRDWPIDEILAVTRERLRTAPGRPAAASAQQPVHGDDTPAPVSIDFTVRIAGQPDLEVSNVANPVLNERRELAGWRGVGRDVTRQRQLEREIQHQASHDSLTGLTNRREFDRRLRQILASSRHDNDQYLAFIDLDRFKTINDTVGHHTGDLVLKQVADLLLATVSEHSTVARLGGDEFGICFRAPGTDIAVQTMYQVVNALSDNSYEYGGTSFQLGASIGLVQITAAYRTADQALSDADISCYRVKNRGGNSVSVFQPDLDSTRHDVHSITELLAALKNNRTLIHVQPIRPLREAGRRAWYEVLLRYTGDGQAPASASQLIPAVERYSRMGIVDIWVLEHVLETWGGRLADGDLRLSLNLSATSIAHPDTARELIAMVEQARIAPAGLCFELTETHALNNIDEVAGFIRAVQTLGCRFMLDNFGGGKTSFSYFGVLPADYLAIDGSYVTDMNQSAAHFSLVEAIHKVGQAHGMRTLAKCVESAPLLESLRELGVDFAQGRFVGPVIPAAQLEVTHSAATRPGVALHSAP